MKSNFAEKTLWFSEQSKKFLRNSGAERHASNGYDDYAAYVHTLIPIILKSGKVPADTTIEELHTEFIMCYVMDFWRKNKAIYDFSESFLNELAKTEDAPMYTEVLSRLPFPCFAMNLPSDTEYDGMVVNLEYDSDTPNSDWLLEFFLFQWKSDHESNIMQSTIRCKNGENLLQAHRNITESSAKAKMVLGYEDYANNTLVAGKKMESYIRIAVSAAYYLASRNAEVREVKLPKDLRPAIVSKQNGKIKQKKVNTRTFEVGYIIGKNFEKQMTAKTSDCQRLLTTEPTGRTVRPHVRRAHWHHYWVGEGRTRLEVRWIEPTFVMPNEKSEPDTAVVRKVYGVV